MTLDAEFKGDAADPWGDRRVVFSAETAIGREDHGLTWNVALETGGRLVGSDVRIGIEEEAIRRVRGAGLAAAYLVEGDSLWGTTVL